jgi:hypothetical protein
MSDPGSAVPYPKSLRRFPVLRQSLLAAFDSCALTSKFDLDFRRGWDAHHHARGAIFHRFAARALREMAMQGEKTIEVDVALAIFHEVLRQDDVDRECPECGSTDILPKLDRYGRRRCANGHRFETEFMVIPEYQVKDLYMAVKKWAYDNSFNTENLIATELRLRATLGYPHPYSKVERVLSGQTDALFVEGEFHEAAVIIDWKDTWALPPPTEVSFKGYFQQRFYAWLVMRQPEFGTIERVTLREFYDRYSEPREATIWRHDLDDIEAELSALVERFDRAYEEDLWPASPGKHCNWCLRPMACPIPQFARGEGRITTPERAESVARQFIVASEVVKQAGDALRAYADVHGPIPVRDAKGSRMLGYVESKRVTRPTREQLEKAIRDAGDVGGLPLDRLYRETTGTRFQAHQPEEVDEAAADEKILEQLRASVEQAQARRESEIPAA